MIRNRHSRCIEATAAQGEALLAGLGTDGDALWPHERWPAMRFKEGLRLGAPGRHGPIRYTVKFKAPRVLTFHLTGPRGFVGWHGFEVAPEEIAGVRLIHRLHLQPRGWARIYWPLALRWLHDACIRDALDKAQAHLEGHSWTPRPLSLWVRFLRRLLRRNPRPQPPTPRHEGAPSGSVASQSA
ncbi:MAG TPA: hypothetical protein VJ600_00565 [Holophagaceae bacterium]|nr:hypothetical protein [Holophagaceae bacterium]